MSDQSSQRLYQDNRGFLVMYWKLLLGGVVSVGLMYALEVLLL